MKNLVRFLSLLAALSLGVFAYAGDKKADKECCKDQAACCKEAKECKDAKDAACCKDGAKAEKKDEKKPGSK